MVEFRNELLKVEMGSAVQGFGVKGRVHKCSEDARRITTSGLEVRAPPHACLDTAA